MIDELADETDLQILLADGFGDALIGYVERCNSEPVALYNKALCLRILMEGGLTPEEAEEYFSFNIIGAWVGPGTPAFATLASTDSE